MTTPRASVVVPAYNAADTIERTVRAALQADEVEVLVCDDGSTDATVDVVDRIGEERIAVLRLPHGGQSRARNAGIERATAPVIVFCDSDDWLASGALEHMLEAFEPDVGVVAGRIEVVGEAATRRWPPDAVKGDLGVTDFLRANWIGGCTAAIRADLARELGGFDPGLKHTMDYNLWIRAAARTRVRMLPDVVGYVQRGRTSFSSDRVGALEDRLLMLERLGPEVAPPDQVREALARTAADLAKIAPSRLARLRWRSRARRWGASI